MALGAEVVVGQGGDFASAGSAFQESFFDQVGLVDLLDRAGIFAEGCGDGGQSDGASVEFLDDGVENLVVDLVEAIAVDVEGFEGIAGDVDVDVARPLDLGEVADAAQQGVGDSGGSAAAH